MYDAIRKSATDSWRKAIETNPSLRELDVTEMPGLVAAYKEINASGIRLITSEFGLKLYDTYGLDVDSIVQLSRCLKLPFDRNNFDVEIDKLRQRVSPTNSFNFHENHLRNTPDFYKYKNEPIEVKVIAILSTTGEELKEAPLNAECFLIFDKTNMYKESGGQQGDNGALKNEDFVFVITDVQSGSNGTILHRGTLRKGSLKLKTKGQLDIERDRRKKATLNHTAAHLLNAAIKRFKGATCQKSSKVTDRYSTLDLCIFGEKLTTKEIQEIELFIRKLVAKAVEVKVRNVNSQELLSIDNVTLIPGEIYPEDDIRLVEIKDDDFLSL